MKKSLATLAVMLSAPIAQAQSMADLIDASEGYTQLAENVLLVETEAQIVFCRAIAPDAAFDAVASGATPEIPAATCIPAAVFDGITISDEPGQLYQIIDTSIGYSTLRDNVLMIETEAGSVICRIPLGDAQFDAFAASGSAGELDPAVCIDSRAWSP